jgi:cell division ATPase FtsA
MAEVNQAVKDACRADYHTHCDKLEVGSEELRTCMRGAALKLSKECLKALVENNEVTKEDIERYYQETLKKAGQ